MNGDRATSGRRARWSRLRSLTAPYRGRLSAIAVASFIGALIEATFLVTVTKIGIAIAQDDDRVAIVAGRSVSVTEAVLVGIGLVFARAVFALFAVIASANLALVASAELRTRLADSFLGASWATQQAEPAGRLQQLVSGFTLSAVGVLKAFATSLTSALSLFALIGIALIVDPFATGLVVAALVVLGVVLAPLRQLIRHRATEAADINLVFASGVSEFGALGLEMQTYGVRCQFSDRIGELVLQESQAERRVDALSQAIAPVYTTLGYAALLGGLAAVAAAGGAELADVGAVMLVMLRSLSYGQALQTSSAKLNSTLPFLDVVERTLSRYEGDRAPGGERGIERIGHLAVEGVSFEYAAGKAVLRSLTFDIPFGEHVGVVGPSGSGKSTLVQLLLGLREPTEGTIIVDAVDLREIDRARWNDMVAFVAQDPQVFTGTIEENIRFFREGINHDEIIRAARDARFMDDITAMSNGFETHVGQRGTSLSGGQRQRLSIARALAGQPEFLILDEPTSALDVKSEMAIRQTLADLRGRVTVVVIAHRLSTLELCDRVMVIQDGRMLGFDTPKSLASSSDFYREALQLSKIS